MDEPFVSMLELFQHGLGYVKPSHSPTYTRVMEQPFRDQFTFLVGKTRYLNEPGITWVLSKSNHKEANDLLMQFFSVVKQERQRISDRKDVQLQKLIPKHLCSVYTITDRETGQPLYVGRDKSMKQDRL